MTHYKIKLLKIKFFSLFNIIIIFNLYKAGNKINIFIIFILNKKELIINGIIIDIISSIGVIIGLKEGGKIY